MIVGGNTFLYRIGIITTNQNYWHPQQMDENTG